jgi:uncharacterized protein
VIPDVNILLAGARPDHAHHAVAKAWWLIALQDATTEQPIRLLPVVVSGFLRVVTHPKIFSVPSTIEEATIHIDALLALPNVDLINTQPSWRTFKKLCVEKSLTGNAIPDVWIAATAVQLSEHVVSFDKDFKKLLARSQVTILPPRRTAYLPASRREVLFNA